MLKTCTVLAFLASTLSASSADPGLLRLVMPDAKVIAGLHVDQARNSLFGQFVLSHMHVDDENFKKFIADTGFDPRRDVSEIVIASNWESSNPRSRWLVTARGVFDLHKVQHVAEGNGTVITNFQGVDIFTYSGQAKPEVDSGIAFFDSSSAVIGDLASVRSAIERHKSGSPASSALLGKVREVSARNDFWFVTLVPISEFADAMPDPNLSSAMQGNLLAAIHEASGGIRFGDTVHISAEAVTRSEKDAQALVDVVKFIANLVQLNRQNNQTAGRVATLLDSLDCKAVGNTTTLSLPIPERQLEQMLETMRQGNSEARKKAVPKSN